MAKAEVTSKWVANNYTCYGSGYCELSHLMYFQEERFYTCGVYGWNFDVYTFGGFAVTTGYRGMIHHVDRQGKLDVEYDKKAKAVLDDSSLSYDQKQAKVNALLSEFLEKVFGQKVRVF